RRHLLDGHRPAARRRGQPGRGVAPGGSEPRAARGADRPSRHGAGPLARGAVHEPAPLVGWPPERRRGRLSASTTWRKGTMSDCLDSIRTRFLDGAPAKAHVELDLFLDGAACVSDVLTLGRTDPGCSPLAGLVVPEE